MSEEGKTIIEIANLRISNLEQKLKIAVSYLSKIKQWNSEAGIPCGVIPLFVTEAIEKLKELENK